MKAVVVVPICGSGNAWKVAEESDPTDQVENRVVSLEIQGNAADGYNLIMSPAGCFTADTWHPDVDEARATASALFGVPPNGWT